MLKYSFIFSILFTIFMFSTLHAQHAQPQSHENLFDHENTDSEYLLAIEKVDEVFQSAYIKSEFTGDVYLMFGDIEQTTKKVNIILRSIKTANLNVRNQQMYYNMLQELEAKLDNQSRFISKQDSILDGVQNRIIALGKDKTILKLTKDSLAQEHFSKELQVLKEKSEKTMKLLAENTQLLNEKKRIILDNKADIFYALQTVEDRLRKSELSLIKQEYPHLWNTDTTIKKNDAPANFSKKIEIEKEVTSYYLDYIGAGLVVLALMMLLLGLYINTNLRYLKRTGYFRNLEKLDFQFLNQGAFIPVLIIGLNILILYSLQAPAVFTTLLHFILLTSICFLFRKNWRKSSMYNWLFLIVLFAVFSFINLFVPVSFTERCLFILINCTAVYYISRQLKNTDNVLFKLRFFRWAGIIFIGLCSISVIFNLFGRVSLSHTLSLTATVALTEVIALSVLLRIIIEIILLQIYRTRVQRGVTTIFDHKSLSDNLKTPFILITSCMWFIVISSNLNIWSGIRTAFNALLTHTIHIGEFAFTPGSVLLFFALVWMAHLLQKYVAYFFGEIEDEDEENVNKKQHSRLMIIRLVLLIGGYLLAVLASGIPLDKISIIIGALGVGVGLGLQGIVSNFVSGIILIFDKAIQIGDIIELNSQRGRVKSMDLRTTKINAPNGSEIIIPNGSLLSQNITNWTYTDNLQQMEISFNLAGNATTENINKIIQQALDHVNMIDQKRPYQIYYNTLSKDSFGLLVKFWCSIYRTDEILSEAKQSIFRNFEEKGLNVSI
ncbi:mechanosensitive ion channel family protein [Elizabethkingia meningoseptica]|uniref:mechanosensitive ion channel family protein n=1 Tax=Elizabethkingia meningoseptica TaxID=238 RepID=UPI0008418B64|nr:mechanosensitive ion channel domain-containing protein [Elizabethkingia meningoseptica]ODM55414.1 mechanosensitive ion channel protein MscS [Elizabethkingia meningoseptica]OHT30621.1 mechanosensitive ion channel protein MscS [Elizabethkingia meningoseptica]OPC15651.1 mechanosensitive ion channel protein MscS [Elizabethkingia meningoseptica]